MCMVRAQFSWISVEVTYSFQLWSITIEKQSLFNCWQNIRYIPATCSLLSSTVFYQVFYFGTRCRIQIAHLSGFHLCRGKMLTNISSQVVTLMYIVHSHLVKINYEHFLHKKLICSIHVQPSSIGKLGMKRLKSNFIWTFSYME